MKKHDFNKKTLTALCLAAAALAAAVGGTLAIYTNQTYQRSVVRNRDNDVIRFSSDKLYRVEDAEMVVRQRYYYPLNKGWRTMTFRVCNYDQLKSTLVHKDTIDYVISFSVTGGSCEVKCGTSNITVSSTGTMDGQLEGGKHAADTYTITLPENYENTEVTVTVKPTKPSLTQNTILTAVLVPVAYGTAPQFSVKREFTDSNQGLPPNKYAAYNVLVSAAGSGTACIKWNSGFLEIDSYFLKALKAAGTEIKVENTGHIHIPMDSMASTGSYLITFYSKDGKSWDSWGNLEPMVTVYDASTDCTQ